MSQRLTVLVIGNAADESTSKMKSPGKNADDVAAKFEACRFSVVKAIDCSNAVLDRTLKRFKRVPAGNDVGPFLFAGHDMQIDGENYLAAVDNDTEAGLKPSIRRSPLNRVYQPFNPDELLHAVRCGMVTEVRMASLTRRRHHGPDERLRWPRSGRRESFEVHEVVF